MSESKLNKISIRREQKHQEILSVAAELMAIHGTSGVSLEDIAKHADVARKTIYNHFENKEALILEMVVPVCDHAKNYLKAANEIRNMTLDYIWTYCIELWEDKSLYAILLHRVNPQDLTDMDEYEHGFIYVFLELLKRIPELSQLEMKKLKVLAKVIYHTYIPLLQSLSSLENYDHLFRKAMTGLMNSLI
ncbi:MAG: TetR/AcrR family transcriptional regulator [Clostridia bacterium]|nr:TetR/AcrR family transcriptional regulator [Clostridia bacterium]